ncbi:hypothetical protein D7030_04705 [Flavobacteriaceae bacterium AU392]|nr:hypothetical protein D1817_11180 [Flavobacteriaceae bacterium]RKM85976.1 hypothetical protein D7030_04705 [Flavobacteriaceae bacterium AU392]
MKLKLLFLPLCIFLLCINCKNNNQTSDDTPQSALKNISELSYLEIYRALFVDNNGGFDAHGDLYGQEAVSYLSFSEEADVCGNIMYLSNTSNKSITLALKSSFNFPGNPENEMLRAYVLPANEKISVGNSKFCYNGKEYNIKKEIISAGFETN